MTTPNQSAEESPRNWRERFIETFGIRTGIMSFIEVELMAERSLLAEKEQEFKSELTAMRGNRDTLNAVRNIIGVKEFHSVIDKAKELVAEHDKLLEQITRLEGELSRYDIIKREGIVGLLDKLEKLEGELASHKIACESFNHAELIQLKEDVSRLEGEKAELLQRDPTDWKHLKEQIATLTQEKAELEKDHKFYSSWFKALGGHLTMENHKTWVESLLSHLLLCEEALKEIGDHSAGWGDVARKALSKEHPALTAFKEEVEGMRRVVAIAEKLRNPVNYGGRNWADIIWALKKELAALETLKGGGGKNV